MTIGRSLASVGQWLLHHLTTVVNPDIFKFRVQKKMQLFSNPETSMHPYYVWEACHLHMLHMVSTWLAVSKT